LHGLPDDVRPRTAAEAYAIQDVVLSRIGVAGGWKVGAKTPTAEPTCAPLPAALILQSPQRFSAGTFARNGVELELAFTIARDLPSRETRYTELELQDAVGTVHAAIEIVDSRFVDIATCDAWSLLADFQSNGALVLSPGVALPANFVPGKQMVRRAVDGKEDVTARGGNPAGSLMRLLAWLANHAAARCGGLRRGDVVTTGSWTGLQFFESGVRIKADFPGVGGVEVAL
jgi:2-keto-4-pentenoate hydratase